jgi:hypothetical protein
MGYSASRNIFSSTRHSVRGTPTLAALAPSNPATACAPPTSHASALHTLRPPHPLRLFWPLRPPRLHPFRNFCPLWHSQLLSTHTGMCYATRPGIILDTYGHVLPGNTYWYTRFCLVLFFSDSFRQVLTECIRPHIKKILKPYYV